MDDNRRRIEYLQIDFMRLFLLARQQMKMSNKRAIPSSYHLSHDAVNCCRRFFKSFIVKLFKDYDVKISISNNRLYIIFNGEEGLALNAFQSLFFKNMVYGDSLNLWTTFRAGNETVSLNFGRLGYENNRVFLTVRLTGPSGSYYRWGGGTRTDHRFYRAALDAMQMKEYLDVIMPIVLESYRKCEEKNKAKGILKDEVKVKLEVKPEVKEQNSSAQDRFNLALKNHMERKQMQ